MTAPARTPNPATITRPERSSKRIARKAPLGWLPWALLGLLALLLLLSYLVVHAVGDNDGGPSNGAAATSTGTQGANGAGNAGIAGLGQRALIGGGSVPAGPAAQTTGAQTLASAPGTAGAVLFAEASAAIDPAGQQVIATAVSNLRSAGAKTVQVIGYTDIVAGAPVNDALSQQRADAVAAALRSQLPGVQITTAAKSQNDPIASNDTDQGRQLNRRVVITAQG